MNCTDHRKTLERFVLRAKRSSLIEKILPILQYGLFASLSVSTAIFIISRLFLFPYYRYIAFLLAIIILFTTIVIFIWKRVRSKEALMRLDEGNPQDTCVIMKLRNLQ